MTNKEKYQRTFSVLHASPDFVMEAKMMKNTKVIRFPKLLAACLIIVIVLGLMTAAYAADIGGIRRTVQVWIHGDQTEAVLEIEDGNYTMQYTDENGEARERGGGGMVIDAFGNERPLTEEEILEHLNEPDVEYRDDGTVWVHYYGESIEITDKFDDDDICYVKLVGGGKTLYMTIRYDDGYAYGPHGYVDY